MSLIAQRSFFQNQTQLISDQGGGLIGNHGGGIVSNHSSGLIANPAAQALLGRASPIVSNHSSGLIGNHGGGIVSNHSSGWRLLQAPAPEVLLATSPLTAPPEGPEELRSHRKWWTGGERLTFQHQDPTKFRRRQVDLHPEGLWAHREKLIEVLAKHPNGEQALAQSRTTVLDEVDRKLRMRYTAEVRFNASGLPTQAKLVGTGTFRFREHQDLTQEYRSYLLDAEQGTGSFELVDPKLGISSTGSLQGVKRDDNDQLVLALGEPLTLYPGTVRVTGKEGVFLYQKTRRGPQGAVQLDFDLGNQTELRLDQVSGPQGSGQLFHRGVAVASARMTIDSGGGLTFTLQVPQGPEWIVGYGTQPSASPAPSARPRPSWEVGRVLGGPCGDQDGLGEAVRFQGLRGLVQDPSVPNRWYAADHDAHRVLQIDAEPGTGGSEAPLQWRVTRLAGTGLPGAADGPGSTATLNGPWGLAIAPGGELYLAEAEGKRIRRLKREGAGWQVSTIAGGGSGPPANGPGALATFAFPTHLALAGAQLFVSDRGIHRVRRIRLDLPGFPVDTVAGQGSIGQQDGPASQAQLVAPEGLAVSGQGLFILTSRWKDQVPALLRRLDLNSGQVSTPFMGLESDAELLDGPSGQGQLLRPNALWPRPEGGFLIGGPYDLRIVLPDGSLASVAGGEGTGNRNGAHDESSFNRICGIAQGPKGYLVTTSPETEASGASPRISELRWLQPRP